MSSTFKALSPFFARISTSATVGAQGLKAQFLIVFVSFIAMLIIALISFWFTPQWQSLILVASTGATITLVFMVPNSPLSQPYPLIMGHVTCATIGVSCAYLPVELYFSAAICVSVCILAMTLLKCMHPPGGATAMMPVIVGAQGVGGYYFVLFPVLLNMVLLLALSIACHRWLLKNEYPSRPLPKADPIHKHNDVSPLNRLGVSQSDLTSTLKEYDAYLDITEKDLASVIGKAQQKAYTRKFGEIRCSDIMSADVKTVEFGTQLEEAWAMLRLHKVKLLPVVDEQNKVIGIISLVDFLKRADLKNYDGFATRLTNFVKRDPKMNDNKPYQVGQIMASPAFTIHQDDLIASLVPLLSDKGLHHIPVVNDQQKLVGIVTQSDLIAALYSGAIAL